MIGIYKIENIVTGEVYIGQSTDIDVRWAHHRKNAMAQNKVRKYALYRDMRRYGYSSFTFVVLEECSSFKLNEREDYWIEYYSKKVHLYNIKIPKGATRK